jgi:hypothetical protein
MRTGYCLSTTVPTIAQQNTPITATHASPITNLLFPCDIGLNQIIKGTDSRTIVKVMENGLAKGTKGNYASAVNAYIKFCDDHGVDISLRFPADERILCAFASSMNKRVAGTTASTAITALKRWHETHNVKWNGSERLSLIIKGVKNNAPKESRRPKRLAVTPRMLEDLDRDLDHNDPKDAAILACAKSAFWGQTRLGELVGTSRLKHDPLSHPSRCSIIILLDNNAREIQLPKTKTSQVSGESIFLTRQSDPLDPVKAIEDHLRLNHGLANEDHLFAYRSLKSCSGRHSLTHDDFMSRVNEVWSKLGYHRVTGHSFRIGGTTTLLRNGVPPDVVKELGRWSSDAFHEYWRDVPSIATRHVEFLQLGRGTLHVGSAFSDDQARCLRQPAAAAIGRPQRQGRPAFRPY